MILREFIHHVHTRHHIPVAQVEQAFKDAAVRCVHEHLHPELWVIVELSESLRKPLIYQAYTVVEEVASPAREVSLEQLQEFEDLADSVLGDELLFELRIDWSARAGEDPYQAYASFLAIPCEHPSFTFSHLEHALSQVWFEYEPPAAFEPGTLGGLMTAADGKQGGWLVGLRGEGEHGALSICEGIWREKASTPQSNWVDFGFEFVWEREDEEEARVLLVSDHRANRSGALTLPADERASAQVSALLGQLCRKLEASAGGWDTLGGLCDWPSYVLAQAQRPARAGGFLEWCRERLLPAFWAAGAPRLTAHAGNPYEVELVPGEISMPLHTLSARKHAYLPADVIVRRAGEVVNVAQGGVYMGGTGALELEAPPAAIVHFLLEWVQRMRERVEQQLQRELDETWSQEHFEQYPLAEGWQLDGGHLDFLQSAEFIARHGPPPEPPVPAFTPEVFARAARRFEEPSPQDRERVALTYRGCTAQPLGILRVEDYLIVCRDDAEREVFGAAEMNLLRDDGQRAQILLTDVWNPPVKWCLDADAFAFRRLSQWLRGVLALREELDVSLRFQRQLDDPGFDPEQEGYAEEELPAMRARAELSLSQWLGFGMERDEDAQLMDWRTQSWAVSAHHGMLSAAEIFGFSAQHSERLREQDMRVWREFLAHIIDARFDAYLVGGVPM